MPFHMMVWKYYCSNNVLIMGSQYSESIWIGMELIHYQKSKIAANMETPLLEVAGIPPNWDSVPYIWYFWRCNLLSVWKHWLREELMHIKESVNVQCALFSFNRI